MSSKGFTLVELALVMVIIGIIIMMAFKSVSLIENARSKKVVAQVTTMVDAQHSYYERNNRFAGDDDNNGMIDYTGLTSVTLNDTAGDSSDADFAFNKLKDQGILQNVANSQIAETANAGQVHFAGISVTASGNTTVYNAVIINNETCNTAFQLEMAIDGSKPDDANSASTGRIVHITGDGISGDLAWNAAGTGCNASSQAKTNIAYLFQ